MIEPVGVDHILIRFASHFFVGQRCKECLIGSPAGREENRILGTEKFRDFLFECEVDVLCTADKTHGSHAIAVLLDAGDRCLANDRMIR